MALAGAGAGSVALLAYAGVLLDLAVQGHQVLSQRDVYGLRADARARINMVYMTSVFIGGSMASAVSGWLHDTVGWTGMTAFGAALPLIAFLIWLRDGLGRPGHGPAAAVAAPPD
jgi:hypothetical protein